MNSNVYPEKCFIAKLGEGDAPTTSGYTGLKTLEELLEHDKQREADGFKRKIRLGKIVKPGKKGQFVIVPTTIEEKFYHNTNPPQESQEEGQSGGTAEGEEGDIIGEAPVEQEGEGEGQGAGNGSGGEHGAGSEAYDIGKVLTEKFDLPNLKDKGKKKSLTKFTYDLTDRNRGSGQIIDKHRTIKQILKTNIALKRIGGEENDLSKLIVNPRDYIYNTLSRERDFENQAVVFFLRDYSGSMYGKPTELVCTQHLLIFNWLVYQFNQRVQSRFILHDTDAKEVSDFNTYYNTNVAGGTSVAASIKLVNKIVEEENLAKDNNIYVFYGGDGGDWNPASEDLSTHLDKMFTYTNRMGMTIIQWNDLTNSTPLGSYIKDMGIIGKNKEVFRMDCMGENVGEERLIEGIKKLVEE